MLKFKFNISAVIRQPSSDYVKTSKNYVMEWLLILTFIVQLYAQINNMFLIKFFNANHSKTVIHFLTIVITSIPYSFMSCKPVVGNGKN